MKNQSEPLVGRQLSEGTIAGKMAEFAKLRLDSGAMATRPGDTAWVPKQNLRDVNLSVAEVSTALQRTFLGAHLQQQLEPDENRFLLVKNTKRNSPPIAGVVVASNKLSKEGGPETLVHAYAAGTDTDAATLCENTARHMAQYVLEQATMYARVIEETMRTGNARNARPAVRFEIFDGLEPTIEALGVDVALKKVMQKLDPLIQGPAQTGSGFGDKMEALGVVLRQMDADMPKHPVTRALVYGWPRLKSASFLPTMGGDDTFYKSQQKAAGGAKHILQAVMKGVQASGDHMFASHEELELDSPTVNEQSDGAFIMTVRLKGGKGIGTVEFSPPANAGEDPVIRFKDFTASSSAISHLAADCIRVAGKGKWFCRVAG